MIFLFGESVYSSQEQIGNLSCPVCREEMPFGDVVETNYFTVFGIRLLPIETLSRYWQCSGCENAYKVNILTEPSHLKVLRRVLVYVMLGYGMSQHRDKVQEIHRKVSGAILEDETISIEVAGLEFGEADIVDNLAVTSQEMNVKGKQQIIEGAFLMTHACCDMQYEDRLRINLMANALGMGIEHVNYLIDTIRQKNYLGVSRLLD